MPDEIKPNDNRPNDNRPNDNEPHDNRPVEGNWEHDRPQPSHHTFKPTRRLLDDFFRVDEYRGSFEQYDNVMSPESRVLVFERGDSAAALLYDASRREVILVEQFRLPTVTKGSRNGWLLEPAAGMIRAGETPRASMIRELSEETGYQLSDLSEIATFFVSPGGSSERIFLYYAEVRRAQRIGEGGGVKKDGENIKTVAIPVGQFFAKLRNREFEDGKLIIAGQWLRERLGSMPSNAVQWSQTVERRLKRPEVGKRGGEKFVGFKTGDILQIKDVDAWVNPVTTEMMLDRFTDRTVSAAIRRGGAERYPDGKEIKSDIIGEALQRAMRGRMFVSSQLVIDTTAGALASTHKVRRIFHVATTEVEMGMGDAPKLSTNRAILEACVDEVLQAVDDHGGLRSVLIPMLGTGDGGVRVGDIVLPLMQRAISYLQRNPGSRIERVYFLGYTIADIDTLNAVMEALKSHFES